MLKASRKALSPSSTSSPTSSSNQCGNALAFCRRKNHSNTSSSSSLLRRHQTRSLSSSASASATTTPSSSLLSRHQTKKFYSSSSSVSPAQPFGASPLRPVAEVANDYSRRMVFWVNGCKHVLTAGQVQPDTTLIDFLRREGLTGTKLACGEGGCGACTVTVSEWQTINGQEQQKLVHKALNSCLVPICHVDGMHVTTVEGLGSTRAGGTGLHPAQEKMAHLFASQCGFCTPGFVMSVHSTLANNPRPTFHQLEKSIDGNLCRCTGYRPILDALRSLSSDHTSPEERQQLDEALRPNAQIQAALEEMKEYKREPLFMKGDRAAWFAPSSLKDLLLLAAFYPDHSTTKYVVGNSEVGIEQRFARKHYPVLISPFHIEELKTFSANDQTLEIGSVLSLSDLWAALECHKSALVNDSSKAHQVRTIQAIIDQLRWFSGTSIRNTACLGGNIVTASPISDLNPVWIALDARFHLLKKKDGKHGKSDDIEERVVSARDFFHRGYRKTELRAEEVVAKVTVPLNEKHQYVRAYKQSRRREDDIAIVNAAISMKVDPATRQITNASLSFGGMAPFTTTAPNTEKYLNGKTWSENTLNEALKVMREEMLLGENTPGGMAEYRTALALSMLYKYWLDVSQQIGVELPPSYLSGARSLSEIDELPEATGNQVYQSSPSVVGRPAVHMSSERQVTGEAVFTDDVAPHPQELFASLVTSSHPYARVEGLDLSAIMEVDEEGRKKFLGTIKGVYTHRDVPGKNVHGDIVKDEEVFASEIVSCVGQPIAVVVAENEHDARLAASKIKVKYAPVKKGHHINDDAIFSINEARAKNSFFPNEHTIRSWKGGDDKELEKQFQELSKGGKGAVMEGQIHIGGQEHFYFEPQVSIVYPLDTEFKVLSSTQNTFKTQKTVASVLGIPEHKVACSVRRIGGGFGGKETQNINFACCAAVAAYHQNRPVRLLLSRDEDMLYTGKRHPFQGNYKVGFTNDGKIQAMDVSLFNNGGNYHDLSWPVLDRALFHCDNSYYVPYLKATGRVCKTNLVSNTAFRGFGGPQGMMVAEACIEHVAHALKLPPHVVRERNLYNDDDVTHYGQKVDVRMKELWRQVMEVSQYEERWKEVEKFNRENRWKKRGMSVLPSKFGIAFTATFLNQGTAMVHVYTDGTVLITHGGVEMGQGLHTKVCQVAAHELDIPLKDVYISETASDKIPNASATAASMGSDLYGMATQMACRELKERLEPYRKKLGSSASLADLATAAYFDRTSLTAQGFYKVPVSGFNFETREGTPFSYFTTGMAATEVEVDTLTGDWRSRRTDIVMDVGASLNPAVDIGQIEGAFVQGLGWSTIEELVWGDREHKWARPGYLKTNGPGAYKIPSADDIPRQLNVYLMKDSKNAKAVHSSRAIGEPPLFLGASCFWAIRHAIQAARADVGLGDEYFRLDSPLTGERIRMACWDHLLETTVGKEQAARYQREFLPKGSF